MSWLPVLFMAAASLNVASADRSFNIDLSVGRSIDTKAVQQIIVSCYSSDGQQIDCSDGTEPEKNKNREAVEAENERDRAVGDAEVCRRLNVAAEAARKAEDEKRRLENRLSPAERERLDEAREAAEQAKTPEERREERTKQLVEQARDVEQRRQQAEAMRVCGLKN